MAAGVLVDSNASVAVSVTGNAMPLQGLKFDEKHLNTLREMFIGVGSYTENGKIQVSSEVYNFCEKEK